MKIVILKHLNFFQSRSMIWYFCKHPFHPFHEKYTPAKCKKQNKFRLHAFGWCLVIETLEEDVAIEAISASEAVEVVGGQ